MPTNRTRNSAMLYLGLVALLVLAISPAAHADESFLSQDHKVECSFEKAIHNRLGGAPPAVLCISEATREEEPELTEECGSHMSGLLLRSYGEVRDTEVCNEIVDRKNHPFVLRGGQTMRSGPFVCHARDESTISCKSLASKHSFELNYGYAVSS